MDITWIAIVFLCAATNAAVYLNAPPDYAEAVAYLLIALLLFVLSPKSKTEAPPRDRRLMLLLLPPVLFAAVIPMPYAFGAILLFIGLALRLLSAEKKLPLRHTAFILPGRLLLLHALFFPLYTIFAARNHASEFLALLASPLLRLFGVDHVREGFSFYITTEQQSLLFRNAWEKAAVFMLGLLLISGVAYLLSQRASWKAYAKLIGIVLVYGLLRYVALIGLYAAITSHSLFWHSAVTAASFLPLGFLLARFVRCAEPYPDIELPQLGKKGIAAASAVLLALCFIGTGFFGAQDNGPVKGSRVMMDEYHADWEWTTIPYDTEWYGEQSGYNYYSLYQHLERFYDMSRCEGLYTDELLADIDTLIIKPPTMAFTEDEIASIVRFVENGGGLFLIGDHTNVFGSATHLNPLSKHFGLTFNYDCTYELVTGSLSEYDKPSILPHPAVQDLPHFLFATSDTLDAPVTAEDVIVGYGLKTLQADYSQDNFFPVDTDAADLEFGLFLQTAAVKHGKGRVIAFTDSTVFSNFWMFMPGKPEMFLGFLDWVNRENIFPFSLRAALGIAFILLFTAALFVWYSKHKRKLGALVTACCLVFVPVSSLVYTGVNAVMVSLPEAARPYVKVVYEREYSQFQIPDGNEGFLAEATEQLNTFYVWAQRLGYAPSVQPTLREALGEATVAVVARPDRDFSDRDKAAIDEFLQAGGSLLLLSDNTEMDAFLEPYGLAIDPEDGADYEDAYHMVNVGGGKLALYTRPELFYNSRIGDVSAVQSAEAKRISELEFAILRELAGEE